MKTISSHLTAAFVSLLSATTYADPPKVLKPDWKNGDYAYTYGATTKTEWRSKTSVQTVEGELRINIRSDKYDDSVFRVEFGDLLIDGKPLPRSEVPPVIAYTVDSQERLIDYSIGDVELLGATKKESMMEKINASRPTLGTFTNRPVTPGETWSIPDSEGSQSGMRYTYIGGDDAQRLAYVDFRNYGLGPVGKPAGTLSAFMKLGAVNTTQYSADGELAVDIQRQILEKIRITSATTMEFAYSSFSQREIVKVLASTSLELRSFDAASPEDIEASALTTRPRATIHAVISGDSENLAYVIHRINAEARSIYGLLEGDVVERVGGRALDVTEGKGHSSELVEFLFAPTLNRNENLRIRVRRAGRLVQIFCEARQAEIRCR